MCVLSKTLSMLPLSVVVGHSGSMTTFVPLLWFGGMVMTLLAATALLLWFRRRMRAASDESAKFPLTLSDLRDQRDQGRLTIAEYDALKEVVIRDAKLGSGETKGPSPDKVLKQRSKR